MDAPCFDRHAGDHTIDEDEVRHNYQAFKEKQEAYLIKVKEWNKDPLSDTKDIIEFLSFIGLRWS